MAVTVCCDVHSAKEWKFKTGKSDGGSQRRHGGEEIGVSFSAANPPTLPLRPW
jgi:hypothetical protein